MKVYIATLSYAYEGTDVLEVFSNEEAAIRYIAKKADTYNKEKASFMATLVSSDLGESWSNTDVDYSVTAWEVLTEAP